MRGALLEAETPVDGAWGGPGLLWAIAGEIGLLDLSGLDPGGLSEMVAAGRRVERAVAGMLVRAAHRADELAVDGVGPGAEGTLIGVGEASASAVRVEAARAGVAGDLPSFAAALSSGSIGPGHLDAVARALSQATDVERAALTGQGDALLAAARRLSVDSFSRHLSRAVQKVRDRVGTSREPEPSELRLWQGRNGIGRIAGSLSPEDYERISSRVAAEMAALCRGSDSSAEVAEGVASPVPLDDRLAARALVDLVSGAGVSSMGRFRTATDAQWAALRSLYAGCAWYGCDRPLDWCQAHHVVYWTPPTNGPTDLANLVPLCSRHHHLAHEGGWRLDLDEDRSLHLHQPDGTRWRTARPDRLAAAVPGCLLTADTPAAERAGGSDRPPPADTSGWAAA